MLSIHLSAGRYLEAIASWIPGVDPVIRATLWLLLGALLRLWGLG
ncbi:MAG TPA: hypothetical protein ACFE0H_01715 [Elainellaceae cyanobacterium]